MKISHRNRSSKNAQMCEACEVITRENHLGAEVELTMLFADVRGSTELASKLIPTGFQKAMNTFFLIANRVLIRRDAIIDKMVGDEVIALFVPGLVGLDHARIGMTCALEIADRVAELEFEGWRIEIGIGLHKDVTYLGHVGDASTSSGITAMGTPMNLTARLVSAAAGWEILFTKQIADSLEMLDPRAELRTLQLKGIPNTLEAFALSPK